jgi:hypothetical protein
MVLNNRVSAFLDYQRLPSISISTYIAGFYARLDNLSQLQMPDDLKGHLLLKQANLELSEKTMVVASAKGSYKVKCIVDSMRQLYGDRADVPVASPSFTTIEKPKKFCNYCKKKNHIETDCWKKRKLISQNRQEKAVGGTSGLLKSTYISYLSDQEGEIHRSGLIDSGAVHTVVGLSTLNKMELYNITRVEKCQPLSFVHRFGTSGIPIEPEFGAIIPWTARDKIGREHCFNFRADVLEGEHPLLIGCPTLVATKASLDFKNFEMKATAKSAS